MYSPADASLIQCFRSSERILAIVGAGLSQPSGLPTFQGDGAFWRGRPSREWARSSTFKEDPISVWTFYESRRQMALEVVPNAGHFALAELGEHKPGLLVVTQNIDGLSERADQTMRNLVPIHGSVFNVRCASDECSYTSWNFGNEPTVPGLNHLPEDLSNPEQTLPQIDKSSIPTCPSCMSEMLRPGVVWYGEKLPTGALNYIDDWLDASPEVDLVLVIGTTRTPYVRDALDRGAAIAYFDFFDGMGCAEHVVQQDDEWLVNGDVSQTLPYLIRNATLQEPYE